MFRLKKKVRCQLNSRTKKKNILKIIIINERNTQNSIFCYFFSKQTNQTFFSYFNYYQLKMVFFSIIKK